MINENEIHAEHSRSIPDSWEVVKLGEVCLLKNGFAFKSNEYKTEGIPIVRISDINDSVVSTDNAVRIEPDAEYEKYVVHKDEILVAMSGATTGKFGIFKGTTKVYQNQRVGKFYISEKNLLDNSFLYYLLHSLKRKILEDAYGGAQPNISSGKIQNLEIPLPPLPEQHRIVSKIEELFTELDKGIETLKTTQQQLKVYRQAVLKWAFEGRLNYDLSDSCDKHDGKPDNQKNQIHQKNHSTDNGELPEGWEIKTLGEIGNWKGGGTPSKSNPLYWNKGTIPWVSPKDMKSRIIRNTEDKITVEAISNSSAKIIPKWSILFVVRSGILRRTFPVALNEHEVTVNQDIQALTPFQDLPDYVYWFVVSSGDEIRRKCAKDGTTVESIESSLLKNFPIPIPAKNEQTKIVQAIEFRLSVCDKMEETIENTLQQAEALRLSILKKAFEGKLVPQDINDESATKLLERIKALRQAQGKQGKEKRKDNSVRKVSLNSAAK